MKRAPIGLLALALLLVMLCPAAARASDWKQLYEEDGVKVSSKNVEGTDIVAFKGDAVLDAPLQKVLWVLLDNEHRMEWVDRLYQSDILEKISDHEYVIYQAFELPIFISNRDYVYHGKATRSAEGVVTLHMSSIEHDKAPESIGVRANLVNSVYRLTPAEDGKKCRIEVEILTDPKGWIPTWIVNMIQKSWPLKTLTGIRDQLGESHVKLFPLPPLETVEKSEEEGAARSSSE